MVGELKKYFLLSVEIEDEGLKIIYFFDKSMLLSY